MTAQEYNRRNIERQYQLVHETYYDPPKTQTEKDLYNLKYMLYGIGHGSLLFRSGCVSALQRAIKRLEGQAIEQKEEPKTQAQPQEGQEACAANRGGKSAT